MKAGTTSAGVIVLNSELTHVSEAESSLLHHHYHCLGTCTTLHLVAFASASTTSPISNWPGCWSVAGQNIFVAVDFARIAGSKALWWCSGCRSGLVFLGGGMVRVLDAEGSMGEGGQGHSRHR